MLKKIYNKFNQIIFEKNDYNKYLDDNEFMYLLYLYDLYKKIQNIPGHIIEVGVASGRNSIIFGKLIKLHSDQTVRKYFGFDTFEGYTDSAIREDENLKKNNDRWKKFSKRFVENRLKEKNLNEICKIFEGDIEKTFSPFIHSEKHDFFNPKNLKVSLLYIDCNSYKTAKASMELFKPYMMPGSIIAIDEKRQGGEHEAIILFAKQNNLNVRKDKFPSNFPFLIFE